MNESALASSRVLRQMRHDDQAPETGFAQQKKLSFTLRMVEIVDGARKRISKGR